MYDPFHLTKVSERLLSYHGSPEMSDSPDKLNEQFDWCFVDRFPKNSEMKSVSSSRVIRFTAFHVNCIETSRTKIMQGYFTKI